MTQLTAERVRDLPNGRSLYDHVVTGLELRARSTAKVWAFRYRDKGGQQRRVRLGPFPTIGIEAARKAAKALAEAVARGEDPSEERRTLRAAPTMRELCDAWLKEYAPRHRSEIQQAEAKRQIAKHITPVVGNLRVADIKVGELQALIDKVPGKVQPNRVRTLLYTMFEFAAHSDRAWRTGRNPVEDVERLTERRRKRKIEAHEFEGIAKALDELQPTWPFRVAALRVMLFCGSRVTELITARREQLKGNRIVLAEHKTADDTGEDREIVLSRQALEIIHALPDDGSGYIFGAGLTRHNVFDVWERARATVEGADDVTVRDVRRTFASVARRVGVDLDSVGYLYGHKNPSTTRRYQWIYADTGDEYAQAVADETERLMMGAAEERDPMAEIFSG